MKIETQIALQTPTCSDKGLEISTLLSLYCGNLTPIACLILKMILMLVFQFPTDSTLPAVHSFEQTSD